MKREHLFVTAWSILICFAFWRLTSYEPKVSVTCKLETKCSCDTSELVRVRKELKEVRRAKYWVTRQRDQLKIDKHELEGRIGDTNVFKRMYFDNEGNLIKAE